MVYFDIILIYSCLPGLMHFFFERVGGTGNAHTHVLTCTSFVLSGLNLINVFFLRSPEELELQKCMD